MTISREEVFERNLELTKQRLLKEIESPYLFEWIPQDARIINLPDNDPEHLRANLQVALALAQEEDGGPIVLMPQPGFEVPWSDLMPLLSGKRIVRLESTRVGGGFNLVFDDGSRLMLFATQPAGDKTKQPVISVAMSVAA